MVEGWICPRCGKVNAPFAMSCDCKPLATSNFSDESSCQHEWEPMTAGSSTAGCWMWFRCRKCGKQKQVFNPYNERVDITSKL